MYRTTADLSPLSVVLRCMAPLALLIGLGGCSDHPTTQPLVDGLPMRELHIATLESGTTYFDGKHGPGGYEHDLASSFAHYIGATPRFIVARDQNELVALIRSGRADIAAAHLAVRDTPPPGILYGPTYITTRPLVVYRRGTVRPKTFADLHGRRLAASEALALRGVLENTLSTDAGYIWPFARALATEDMLALISDGQLDHALLPSTDFEAAQRMYPETEVAFEFGAPAAIAWMYSADQHFELGRQQLAFFRAMRANGALAGVTARYFSPPREFGDAQSRDFLAHYAERLPTYRQLFKRSAADFKLDWQLLAAMSYQESHWRKDATSPTGVRGLMMLTQKTAAALKVDRLDPHASIRGGAAYLVMLKRRLPARISGPDRTWLALAAYNIGPAHLERARVLTARAGRNPDAWDDVRQFLPRIRAPRGRAQLPARGYQAVRFVDNTRRYYETLRWLEGDVTGGAVAAHERTATDHTPVL